MDSVALLSAVRYYLSTDATLRNSNHLNASTEAAARNKILIKDGTTVSIDGSYSFPIICLKLNDGEAVALPTNEEFLELMIINTTKGSAVNQYPLTICTRIKDRLKYLMANKCSSDDKHVSINVQGQLLGTNPKVRGMFWVSALTYDDKEQGSERLHRINCVVQMIVGD